MHAAQSLLDERLRAIADPTRRDILQMVRRAEQPAGDIAARFDMARPSVSRHLKVLTDAGLLTVRQKGTMRLFRADETALQDMQAWFDAFWTNGLPRLKALAEREMRDG